VITVPVVAGPGIRALAPAGPPAAGLPEFMDWVALGKVPAVKSQGRCGACWAFSAVSTIETAHAIATGTLATLSEQQLVDCNSKPQENGCNGGYVRTGYEFAILGAGFVPSEAYPYSSVVRAAFCRSPFPITFYARLH
jgi:C1A family cysteine protease